MRQSSPQLWSPGEAVELFELYYPLMTAMYLLRRFIFSYLVPSQYKPRIEAQCICTLNAELQAATSNYH